ncbi:hypothetical protein VB780_01005 [Leptolyngbya sp. CCNP1308]|uniref:hypothetical protein n=1 Tax=Leptolyngbya sp. CCNP1308 TaxID=3110255 RepID=UPI002B1F07EA|nr:hypothetical protein [Leptolyngbya sp. CCNP1308]MEA5447128.1 hypothetical protein [Leptolyngbya sp. CCNP1308]
MLRERPIPRQYRGPATAAAAAPATAGDNLAPLIAEVDALRFDLGYPRWSSLRAWCDDGDPLTTDQGGLERLVERLCILWEGRCNHG